MISLTEAQNKLLNEFVDEQRAIAVEEQKRNLIGVPTSVTLACWEQGYPYTGATGGDLTYLITPTSIGVIIKVRYNPTTEIIDLTDYDLF